MRFAIHVHDTPEPPPASASLPTSPRNCGGEIGAAYQRVWAAREVQAHTDRELQTVREELARRQAFVGSCRVGGDYAYLAECLAAVPLLEAEEGRLVELLHRQAVSEEQLAHLWKQYEEKRDLLDHPEALPPPLPHESRADIQAALRREIETLVGMPFDPSGAYQTR